MAWWFLKVLVVFQILYFGIRYVGSSVMDGGYEYQYVLDRFPHLVLAALLLPIITIGVAYLWWYTCVIYDKLFHGNEWKYLNKLGQVRSSP